MSICQSLSGDVSMTAKREKSENEKKKTPPTIKNPQKEIE